MHNTAQVHLLVRNRRLNRARAQLESNRVLARCKAGRAAGSASGTSCSSLLLQALSSRVPCLEAGCKEISAALNWTYPTHGSLPSISLCLLYNLVSYCFPKLKFPNVRERGYQYPVGTTHFLSKKISLVFDNNSSIKQLT